MKRFFAILLILAVCLSLFACGNNSDKPIVNNEVSSTKPTKVPNNTKEDVIYSNKVYYVGDDIPKGSYAIHCTKTEYSMEILIFENEQQYKDFESAKKSTNGEYQVAVGTYAWAQFYIDENEYVYVGLNEGYVILLDNGMCEFNKCEADSTTTIYSGVYVIGEDIAVGDYAINCTKAKYYSMEVLVFESEQQYRDFHSAKKSTNGEYKAAVGTCSWSQFYIDENEYVYVGLNEGYVLVINDGMCEIDKHNTNSIPTIYSGIYVVGEDIAAEKINIKCISDYMRVVVFESKDNYVSYHKADRNTNGEETAAIEAFAFSCAYVNKDEVSSVNLKDGMILMVNNGFGEYSVDNGPVIN